MERKEREKKELKQWLDSFLATSGSEYKVWTKVPGVAQSLRENATEDWLCLTWTCGGFAQSSEVDAFSEVKPKKKHRREKAT